MSTVTAFDVLEQIEATQGSLAKQAILTQHAGNNLLREVFRLTSDPYTNFYIAKVPKVKHYGGTGSSDTKLNALLTVLSKTITRELVGNAARDAVANVLKTMSDLEFKWAGRIITRKLRTGIGDSGIEKVWPGLVPSFEVSLADKIDWRIDNGKLVLLTPIQYPCRVEPKWDGFRCVAVKVGGETTLFARSGRVFDRALAIKAWLDAHMPDDTVFDGELMGQEWNDTAEILGSRKNHKDDAGLSYHVFDTLHIDTWKTQGESYSLWQRLLKLRETLEALPEGPVKLAEGHSVSTEKELLRYYEECLGRGYEGVMVKKMGAPYTFKRCDNVLKLKPIVDYDCVVVGVAEGREQTKWSGKFTILEITLPGTSRAITRVGTGTSDDEKKIIDIERTNLVGKPCTIQGQPPISSDGKIRFPRFLRWREKWDCSLEVRNLIEEVLNE